MIYSTADLQMVQTVQQFGVEKISKLLETLMGHLAIRGYLAGFRHIIVGGGETSGAVVTALQANACRIGADAAPGVPEMWPLSMPDLCLVLKSGNFGQENFFLQA